MEDKENHTYNIIPHMDKDFLLYVIDKIYIHDVLPNINNKAMYDEDDTSKIIFNFP